MHFNMSLSSFRYELNPYFRSSHGNVSDRAVRDLSGTDAASVARARDRNAHVGVDSLCVLAGGVPGAGLAETPPDLRHYRPPLSRHVDVSHFLKYVDVMYIFLFR